MAIQSTPRKSIAKQSAVARRLLATSTVAPHVLASTVEVPGLSGEVIIRKAGRSFTVNGLAVRKGETCILVASKFENRFYVCSHHEWSTKDAAVIAKCRAAILKHAA